MSEFAEFEEEHHYRLIFPFVACASNGGPYDDAAFVAGARYGEISAALQDRRGWMGSVEPALLPQLDLLAMHQGYTLEVDDPDLDGWAYVRLSPGVS